MSLTYYHKETPQRIDSDRTNEILKVMIDPISRKILVDIKDNSKTILQISKDLELTISKTYRTLNKLNKKKLLIVTGEINSRHKKTSKYKSKIRKIIRTYDDIVTDVKIYSNLRD
jgi:DNA-binding transcriptional ArsR family regulator